MDVFSSSAFDHHEQVVYCHDRETGLRAIIALHDLSLGPALGGCRVWSYDNDDDALTDVLRLSRGMTYKAALAGLAHGGGKTVVMGVPQAEHREALFAALGRAVDSLHGRYVIAEDVGTTPLDMDAIARTTRHVLGRSDGSGGDPSPMTARGVAHGIRAAVRHRLNRSGLCDVRVAVQGVGLVGRALAKLLAAEGARLVLADIDSAKVARVAEELAADVVAIDAITGANVDVFAPCALGGVIDDHTIERLTCSIVAGSANNQLLRDDHGDALRRRGILYAPDYVINAGGLISIAGECHPRGYDRTRTLTAIDLIEERLGDIFARADRQGRATNRVADELALGMIASRRQAA